MAFILAALAIPLALNHIGENYVSPALESVGKAYDNVVEFSQRMRDKKAKEAAEQEKIMRTKKS